MRLVERSRGPEEVLAFRSKVWGGLIGAFFTPVGYPLAVLLNVPVMWRVPFAILFGVTTGYIAYRIMHGVSDATGEAFGHFLQPRGRTTPYAATYSFEQSLAARGDVAGALRAYDEAMLNNPEDPEPRRQAAELHLRAGDSTRAAELFSELRRLAGDDRSRELYATQRLVDLYLGPLAAPGQALVELRRLTERFPSTHEAAAARRTIARLKSRERSEG